LERSPVAAHCATRKIGKIKSLPFPPRAPLDPLDPLDAAAFAFPLAVLENRFARVLSARCFWCSFFCCHLYKLTRLIFLKVWVLRALLCVGSSFASIQRALASPAPLLASLKPLRICLDNLYHYI